MYATTKDDYHGLLKEGYNKTESAGANIKTDTDLKGEKTNRMKNGKRKICIRKL